jgi:hypothetical protein
MFKQSKESKFKHNPLLYGQYLDPMCPQTITITYTMIGEQVA